MIESEVFQMNEFLCFSETGALKIEQVFLDAGYPILFTARNEVNELYLCVCCRNNEQGKKWLLAQTTPGVILGMLKDEITIRDAFVVTHEKRFTIIQGSELTIEADVKQDWDVDESVSLPDAGEYMEVEEGEFDEEIAFYRGIQLEEIYKTIMKTSLAAAWDWTGDTAVDKEVRAEHQYAISLKETKVELELSGLRKTDNNRNYSSNINYAT